MRIKNIEAMVREQLKPDEELVGYCYGLIGLKGHCLGVTNTRLIIVRVSFFLGRVKEVISVPLRQVMGVEYEVDGRPPLGLGYASYVAKSARLQIKTQEKPYDFNIVRAAGFSGGENFELAHKLYDALKK